MIQGIVQKIMTLSDGTMRFFVDVPMELAPDDVKSWMFEQVAMDKEEEIKPRAKTQRRKGKQSKK